MYLFTIIVCCFSSFICIYSFILFFHHCYCFVFFCLFLSFAFYSFIYYFSYPTCYGIVTNETVVFFSSALSVLEANIRTGIQQAQEGFRAHAAPYTDSSAYAQMLADLNRALDGQAVILRSILCSCLRIFVCLCICMTLRAAPNTDS